MTGFDSTRTQPHLDPADVTGYVGHGLSIEDRRRVERHLADCELCTEEVVAVARLGRRRGTPRWLPYAAAAAVIAGVVLLVPRAGQDVGGDRLRDGGVPADSIAVVAPADGRYVGASRALVWRGVPGATYQVTITTSDGDSLWAAHTSDTAVTLPPTVTADSGLMRHWYVDALLPDGSTRSTGMRSFRTGP
jgi:hypothetical protein